MSIYCCFDLEDSKAIFMHDTLAHVDAPMYQFHHKKFSGSEGIKLSEQKHTNDYNIYPSLKGSKK